jgi:hypothetical protein
VSAWMHAPSFVTSPLPAGASDPGPVHTH